MLVFLLAALENDEDKKLFTEIYEQYRPQMERTAMHFLKSHADIEDAVQNAFMQMIRHFEKIYEIPCEELSFWIISIVKNEALMIIRKSQKTVPLEDWDGLVRESENTSDYTELVDLFTKLPPSYRSVLEMKILHGFSDKEVAAHLGISETAVSSRASRGRSLLREIVKKGGLLHMTDQELDQLMQRVLLDAIKSDCSNMSCEIPNFMPSHRYQHQMAIMIANPLKWAHKRARPLWKKVLQRVAVILIVFSLSLGSLMIISPSVRAAVVNWVTEWYETHITYRYSGSPISGEMPQYEIVELPDGYVEVEEQALYGANYVYKTYYNEDTDRTMFFNYVYMQQGSAWDYSTENVEVIPVSVHGMKGQMFLTDDWEHEWNTITWIDAQNNIQFSIDGNFDADDILHIAESVSLVNSTK